MARLKHCRTFSRAIQLAELVDDEINGPIGTLTSFLSRQGRGGEQRDRRRHENRQA
jgi:hypothetical protein